MTQYIDLTPSLPGYASMLLEIIENGSVPETRMWARRQMMEIVEAADALTIAVEASLDKPKCLKDQLVGLPMSVRRDLVTAIRIADIAIEESVFKYGAAPKDFGVEEFQQTALVLQRLHSFAEAMETDL